ncbi:MAG: deoxyribose-phosphate aldolase [Bacteroidales bacterium]|nr:deoxyribose-phosphate aldolase [Bacteroidales bacterium]
MIYKYDDIAKMIDHSLLKPFLTDEEIVKGCELADRYHVASVCVRPGDVSLACKILKKSSVIVGTVIGFPHGSTTTVAKMEETKDAIENGAMELDVVLHFGKLKSGKYDYVKEELKLITSYSHHRNVKIKVIFENCYLTDDEKIKACVLCNEIGVDWVKTSTGYGTGGAEDHDLILMRKYTRPEIRLKAAGGIRTLERAIEVKELGCTRIGATATADILDKLIKS